MCRYSEETSDERDILSLRVHTMTVELEASQADVVVAQLRRDFAAAEAARRQSQMEASVATSTLQRQRDRGDKSTEEAEELKVGACTVQAESS